MKKLWQNYNLSIVLIALFLLSWVGQFVFQYQEELSMAQQHGTELTAQDFGSAFLSATFENWQSEFLQLTSMVLLTSFLVHKGSAESKDGEEEVLRLLRRIDKKLK
jgi:hypothetical protein